jgi:hypothetical protein
VDRSSDMDTARAVNTAGRPYAFLLAVTTLTLISITFVVTMAIFRNLISAEQVVRALASVFGIFGTVVGAYFGIKISSDTIDKTQAARSPMAPSASEPQRHEARGPQASPAGEPQSGAARGPQGPHPGGPRRPVTGEPQGPYADGPQGSYPGDRQEPNAGGPQRPPARRP